MQIRPEWEQKRETCRPWRTITKRCSRSASIRSKN